MQREEGGRETEAVKGGDDDDKIPKISGVTVGSKNASFSSLIDPTSSFG